MKKSLIVASLLLAGTSLFAEEQTKDISKSLKENNIFMGIEFGSTNAVSSYNFSDTDPDSSENTESMAISTIGIKIGKMLTNDTRVYMVYNIKNEPSGFECMSFSYDKILDTSSESLKIFYGASYAKYSIDIASTNYANNDLGAQSSSMDGTAIMVNLGTIIKTTQDLDLEIGYRHSISASGSADLLYKNGNYNATRTYDIEGINTLYFGINKKF